MSVDRLLRDVSAELKAIRAARERYAVKLSPDFNCFDYIEPDELCLSQILADLLDPKGSHAQVCRFLDAFLQRIGLCDWTGKPVEWVKTEDRTTGIDQDRRVDIRIRWTDGRELVIENKPWANDSEDQLRHYIEDLARRNIVVWHVVYLGGTSAEPSESSLPKVDREKWQNAGKLTLQTYGDLIVPWLTECVGNCESDRFRWFLGEFKAYVLAEFRGERDMAVTNAVVEQIVKSPDNVEAAFEIIFAKEHTISRLLEKLRRDILEKIQPKGWCLKWDIDKGAKKCENFDIRFRADDSYWLRFQFEHTNFNCFFVGIWTDNKPAVRPEIKDVIRRANLSLSWSKDDCNLAVGWQCYSYLRDNSLKDWKSSIPWKKISEGRLAELLFDLIEKVHAAFEKEEKLGLLH